jgi:hypothetical protein
MEREQSRVKSSSAAHGRGRALSVAASGAVVGANLVLLNGAHRRLVDLESKSRSCGSWRWS